MEIDSILKIISGSHLYGTNTETSDKDFMGIFMPTEDYVFGLKTIREIDLGKKDKDKSGKNTEKAVDEKQYEFRNFLNLALGNNPNILEVLFVNKESIISENRIGESLRDLKNSFPSRTCLKRFGAYANSQKHKMIIRKDHFHELRFGLEILEKYADKDLLVEVFNSQDKYIPGKKSGYKVLFSRKTTGGHIYCGDVCFEPGVQVKKARSIIQERLSKITNRSELVLKYGYDTKFGSHLIRLLLEGIELLETGSLVFPLREAELIRNIKLGQLELGKLIELSNQLEKKLEETEKHSVLPKLPDYKRVELFCINTMREWFDIHR